jgi:hypothetical protein
MYMLKLRRTALERMNEAFFYTTTMLIALVWFSSSMVQEQLCNRISAEVPCRMGAPGCFRFLSPLTSQLLCRESLEKHQEGGTLSYLLVQFWEKILCTCMYHSSFT